MLDIAEKYPILKYRLLNMIDGVDVRGLKEGDSERCYLVLDDFCVVKNKVYPCVIYFRERGAAVTEFTNIESVRQAMASWSENHNCLEDPICRSQCLDCLKKFNCLRRDSDATLQIS
jgi:hypothetical protein